MPLNSERSTTTNGTSDVKSTTNSSSTTETSKSTSRDSKSNDTDSTKRDSTTTVGTLSNNENKSGDEKKSSKRSNEVVFDKNAYEHTVQQLIRQSLYRKQPE